MKKKDLIKKLNSLQHKIKPDQDWQQANREILLSQIKAQTRLDLAAKPNNLWAPVFGNQILKISVRSFASLCAVFLIVFGSWIATTSATKNSLPGDLLYGLKLTTERVQANLTLDDEKRTNLELEFADRRINEVNKVMSDEDNGKDKNKENVDVALEKFQENLDNVKFNLAKLEINDTPAAIKIANMLDEKTEEYEDVLRDHQDNSPELVMETEQAITASQATADKALSVIIKEHESGEGDLSQEELITKIEKRINKLETKTEIAQSDITNIIKNKELALLSEEAVYEEEDSEAEETESSETEEQVEEDTEQTEEEVSDDNQEEQTEEEVESTESDSDNEEGDQSSTEEEDDNEEVTTEENTTEEGTEEGTEEQQEEPAEQQEEVQEEEILPTIDEIKERPEEILALLAEAKELLTQNEISQAFDKIKQANDILTILNKVININIEFLPEEGDITEENPEQAEDENTNEEEETVTDEQAVNNEEETDSQE